MPDLITDGNKISISQYVLINVLFYSHPQRGIPSHLHSPHSARTPRTTQPSLWKPAEELEKVPSSLLTRPPPTETTLQLCINQTLHSKHNRNKSGITDPQCRYRQEITYHATRMCI